ncbi:MAG: selenoprotein glycine/betaine/sarcosine/D-proline reductase family [Dehalococcoidia bacterium]|nr:selenoprotein glycine/betaine/sarcosine/D-proline reductase family [Dehalococcoidia bacterium]
MEKAGIPVVQITAVTPVARMVGSNRVIQGHGIVHPLGDADLPPEEEKELRRQLVQQALEALKREVKS